MHEAIKDIVKAMKSMASSPDPAWRITPYDEVDLTSGQAI
jgi:hypothetical protein